MDHHFHNWLLILTTAGLSISAFHSAFQMARDLRELDATVRTAGKAAMPTLPPGLLVHFLVVAGIFLAFIAAAHLWSEITGVRLNSHTWAGPLFFQILGVLTLYALSIGLVLLAAMNRFQAGNLTALAASLEESKRKLQSEQSSMTDEQYALSQQLLARMEERAAALKQRQSTEAAVLQVTEEERELYRQLLETERGNMTEAQYREMYRLLVTKRM